MSQKTLIMFHVFSHHWRDSGYRADLDIFLIIFASARGGKRIWIPLAMVARFAVHLFGCNVCICLHPFAFMCFFSRMR